MGTNYYLEENPCDKCRHSKERLHIGKSSGGWCFSLHYDRSEGLESLDDWIKRIEASKETHRIVDEYGGVVTLDELLKTIKERSWDRPVPDTFDYKSNYAELGPNGLVRHKVGPHCVAHGEGTWDLIPGEFS